MKQCIDGNLEKAIAVKKSLKFKSMSTFWSEACSVSELRPLSTLLNDLYVSSGFLVSLGITLLF